MKLLKKKSSKALVKVTPAPVWEPYFERMQEFERSMMRQFREFFAAWRVGESEMAPLNMRETEREFIVSAAMPGFKEGEVEVRVEPQRMFLHAEHEEATKKEPVFEEYREFTRWVEFPVEVKAETAKAVLSKGVLEVTVEKAQAGKRITVHPKAA
jgi:HSP20 family molecular chaperone IbpA